LKNNNDASLFKENGCSSTDAVPTPSNENDHSDKIAYAMDVHA
jgi:hypothetical protein